MLCVLTNTQQMVLPIVAANGMHIITPEKTFFLSMTLLVVFWLSWHLWYYNVYFCESYYSDPSLCWKIFAGGFPSCV